MPALTRLRYPEHPDCWHVYYDDVQVGSIGMRSGVPNGVDQWGWTCGFISQRLKITEGTACVYRKLKLGRSDDKVRQGSDLR